MPVKEYLEPAETSLIEDQAQCLRDKVLIRLLRRLGCRVTEALRIEERHIDFARHYIRIEHEKVRWNLSCPSCTAKIGKSHSFCPQCGSDITGVVAKESSYRRLRKVPVDADTLKLLKDYIKKGGCTDVKGKKMLFTFSRQWAWHIVRECADRAGFTELENPQNEKKHHVSPHKFRDAFAINAMKKRPTMDDARLLQELLGHSRIDTTMRYRKVASSELQEFYNSLMEQ